MSAAITRSELAAMDPAAQMALILEGKHRIVNDPPAPKAPRPEGAMTRAHFDTLSPAEKATAARERNIVD
jgi:hypothetical protein